MSDQNQERKAARVSCSLANSTTSFGVDEVFTEAIEMYAIPRQGEEIVLSKNQISQLAEQLGELSQEDRNRYEQYWKNDDIQKTLEVMEVKRVRHFPENFVYLELQIPAKNAEKMKAQQHQEQRA